MEFKDWLSVIISVCTLATLIIMFYRSYRDPDIKAESDIGLLRQGCDMRHKGLDKEIEGIHSAISGIEKTFMLFQENDFKHIENSVRGLELKQERIFTILNERLPKKND
jgi:hypothetical protein